MDDLERRLLRDANALIVEAPLVRRAVKSHRRTGGMVPHSRCYALARSDLLAAGFVNELGLRFDELPDPVILVARATRRVRNSASEGALLTRYWRAIVHARIHLALDEKMRAGRLDAAAVRLRVERIGQIEFDEVRAMLRHDDLVLPPYDDREVYAEFAALYLELRQFAPLLLVSTFPGLSRFEEVDAMLAEDLDVGALFEEGRPPEVEVVPRWLPSSSTVALNSTRANLVASDPVVKKPVSTRRASTLVDKSRRASAAQNDVGAALWAARAATVEEPELLKRSRVMQREALDRLGSRLSLALRPPEAAAPLRRTELSWRPLLEMLCERAALERTTRFSVEARLLYALQIAAVASERSESRVDFWKFLISRGSEPVVRPLPATRELRIARHFAVAAKLVRHTRLEPADRKLLARLTDVALSHAEENVRVSLRPRILHMLQEVGLEVSSDPERLARDKLVEELLDTVVEQGYLSFGLLRDAFSRNQLKLPDLESPNELWRGDHLLRADRCLAANLEGAYHASEVYLRAFQKISSVPFGTAIGRRITLFLLVPFGGAAVVLAALEHFARMLGSRAPIFSPAPLLVSAALIFGLVHSAAVRGAAMQVLEWIGVLLGFVFIRIPRAVLMRPTLLRWFALSQVRLVLRRVVVPALVALGSWFVSPLKSHSAWLGLAATVAVFLVSSVLLDSRVGAALEEVLFDQLAPRWKTVSRQWLPSLLRRIGQFFDRSLEFLDRVIYRVDEALRFRQGQSQVAMWSKGALGVVWGLVAYVVRIYVTLLVEPFVNPLKHFPVVVVADKLMLAYMPRILDATTFVFSPLGTLFGGFLAWITMFLSPSIFGFLAWELKENYKLYRATRPDEIQPAYVGKHGETVKGLLVLGMHSGTLPRLYERLRRAAQREDDAAVWRLKPRKSPNLASLGAFREGLYDVEQAVKRFVERELVVLLGGAVRWRFGEITVDRTELSSNRIRVRMKCPALGEDACELRFEEQSGFVVAGIAEAGFLARLVDTSTTGALLFENALAGLYHRAEVELVREQIEDELGGPVAYDIADEGLLVWPDESYRTELVYPLGSDKQTISAKVIGDAPRAPTRVLDSQKVMFRKQRIQWNAWVAAWSAAAHESATIPRLVRGASLLPARRRPSDPPTDPRATVDGDEVPAG